MALVTIFLSGKLEESVKSLRMVISVHNCIKIRRLLKQMNQISSDDIPPLDMSTSSFWDLKENIVNGERYLLDRFGFNTLVEHPHKFLLNYLHILQLKNNKDLVQLSWNLLNDSFRSAVCVMFKPEVIASACIYMASRISNFPLHESPEPWWLLFDATLDEINEFCWNVNNLYKQQPSVYISLTNFKPPNFE